MNKKNNYIPKSFESDKTKLRIIKRDYDTSANIYMSMLFSDAWKELSKGQQVLYLYCKAQYYGKHKRQEAELITWYEKTENKKIDTSLRFFMNREMWLNLYEIYSDNGQFYKDMNKLIKLGFIKIVENNSNTRQRNIYEFSSDWRNYQTGK